MIPTHRHAQRQALQSGPGGGPRVAPARPPCQAAERGAGNRALRSSASGRRHTCSRGCKRHKRAHKSRPDLAWAQRPSLSLDLASKSDDAMTIAVAELLAEGNSLLSTSSEVSAEGGKELRSAPPSEQRGQALTAACRSTGPFVALRPAPCHIRVRDCEYCANAFVRVAPAACSARTALGEAPSQDLSATLRCDSHPGDPGGRTLRTHAFPMAFLQRMMHSPTPHRPVQPASGLPTPAGVGPASGWGRGAPEPSPGAALLAPLRKCRLESPMPTGGRGWIGGGDGQDAGSGGQVCGGTRFACPARASPSFGSPNALRLMPSTRRAFEYTRRDRRQGTTQPSPTPLLPTMRVPRRLPRGPRLRRPWGASRVPPRARRRRRRPRWGLRLLRGSPVL